MIFTYHNISFNRKNKDDKNTVSLFNFILHMIILKITLCQVVSLDEYLNMNEVKQSAVVLTFDDGYKNIKKYVIPILKFFNFPFEIFVSEKFLLSSGTRFLSIEDLSYCIQYNGHIQYHSKSHIDLSQINDSENLYEEIVCPAYLKEIDKSGCKFFAYPYWSYNDKVIDITKKYYDGACSGNGKADNSNYALDRIKITNDINIFKVLKTLRQ